ncbi:hypothetical protein F4777DRAFT_597714 [Nemania sp. FL0916]|nr:hypothetical protein F4777DRAFT_597714 [Nemania sp. FL0916]
MSKLERHTKHIIPQCHVALGGQAEIFSIRGCPNSFYLGLAQDLIDQYNFRVERNIGQRLPLLIHHSSLPMIRAQPFTPNLSPTWTFFYSFPTSVEHKKHKEQLAKEKKQQRAREGQRQESQDQGFPHNQQQAGEQVRQAHHQYSNHGTPAYNQPRTSAQNLPSIPEEDIPDNSQYNYSGSNGNAGSYSPMPGGTQYRYSQGVVDREYMHSYSWHYHSCILFTAPKPSNFPRQQ